MGDNNFVVETKPSLDQADLLAAASGKIDCAKAHFAALTDGQANPAKHRVETDEDGFVAKLN